MTDDAGAAATEASSTTFLYTGEANSDIPPDLRRLVVDPSVKKIGGWAFHMRQHLVEVSLPDGLHSIGDCAFGACHALRSISIPASVESIGVQGFAECTNLTTIDLREGLVRLGISAFDNCSSLRRISIPSSVETVGPSAFRDCAALEEVEFRGGMKHILEQTFGGCTSLRRVTLPASIRHVGREALGDCRQLTSVQLGDEVGWICPSAFRGCASLRNVAIPARAVVAHDAFEGCYDLLTVFGCCRIHDALKGRWNELPVHKLCYDHSYNTTSSVIEMIQDAMRNQKGSSQTVPVDCLGMTPLHLLACSTKQDIDLYRVIVDAHPESLVTEDGWGCIPLLYAIWGEAPRDIIHYLVSSLRSAHPDAVLNWDRMIETLCRAGASLAPIEMLFDIQRMFFPDQRIDREKCTREMTLRCLIRCERQKDWESLTEAFAEDWGATMEAFGAAELQEEFLRNRQGTVQYGGLPDPDDMDWQEVCEGLVEPLKGWWRPDGLRSSLKTLHFLVKCNIPERLNRIGLRKWRLELLALVERISSLDDIHLENHNATILSRLITYEREYCMLKDASFLLELALWKCKIHETEMLLIDGDTRLRCRISCGAGIIVPCVMPFLICN